MLMNSITYPHGLYSIGGGRGIHTTCVHVHSEYYIPPLNRRIRIDLGRILELYDQEDTCHHQDRRVFQLD